MRFEQLLIWDNSDCFAAIMRTYYTWQLTESIDVSWNIAFMAMWTWIEMSFGILVASLPVSPRFYQFIKQRLSILMTGSGKKRVSTFTESENTRATSEGASISLSSVGHAKSSETGAYYEIESPARVNFPHKM